uniref:Large proline-rich protein BAT3 n=1 Tax=Rhizophora mucronata TaxID=61149 RepID=A0A2P2LMR6_RHIMU
MADQHSNEGSSTSNVFGGSSDSTIEINIKTLESRIYSFRVDRNMPVAVFKEKIADETGVPVGQQRLIFRGKVLKDEHLLSEYRIQFFAFTFFCVLVCVCPGICCAYEGVNYCTLPLFSNVLCSSTLSHDSV